MNMEVSWHRWGAWQTRLALLLALPVLLTGMYGTNYVFLAAKSEFRCHVPECEDQIAFEDWSTWALPEDSKHHRWSPIDGNCTDISFDNTTLVACEIYVYESRRSIFAEFDLAGQDWMRSFVGTIHNVGMLVSLPIMGYVSDKYGRRAALVVSGAGAGVLGLCKSLVTSYPMYLSAEFVETVLGASVYPAAFVLMIEWLGVEQRVLASLVLGIPLSLGAVTLALLDYLTGYWRVWARFAYPPSFILLLYPWLLPESIRWLVTQGRRAEAGQVLKIAAKVNNLNVTDDTVEKMLSDEVQPPKDVPDEDESLLRAICRYPVLRQRLFICCLWWISAVFVFYGLAVSAPGLSGSMHVNCALVAAAELPALVANTLLLDRVGRRPLLTAALMLTAASLVGISCLPSAEVGIAGTILFILGKIGATMTLNALYVYTAELFPTRARHRLLATCSMCGRVGAILAPMSPLLAVYRWWIPTLLFGTLPLLSATLTRFVPDTLHQQLPDSFADLQSRENLKREVTA